MLTPPQSDLAGVVARLTKAEQRMLTSARETVLMDRMKCPGRMKSLRAAGLAVAAWRGGDLLTPLGLAVRAYLSAQSRTEGE